LNDSRQSDQEKRNRNDAFDYVLAGLVFLASFISGGIKSDAAPNQNQDRANNEIAHWTRVVGIWTRWLVIVGAISGAILLLQFCVLQKTDETQRAIQRAFISVQEIKIDPIYNGDAVSAWDIHPLVENSGYTPTKDLKYYVTSNAGPYRTKELSATSYPAESDPSIIDPEFWYYFPQRITSPECHWDLKQRLISRVLGWNLGK
jgi:hypothetical protein